MSSDTSTEMVRSFTIASHKQYNHVELSNHQSGSGHPAVGLIEIDSQSSPTLLTRLELAIRGWVSIDRQPSVSGFIHLAENTAALDVSSSGLSGEIPVLIGLCISDAEQQQYAEAEATMKLELSLSGSTLRGRATATVPTIVPGIGGSPMSVDLLGQTGAFGMFRAKFNYDETVDAASLRIAGQGWSREIARPDKVDLLIPSHSTITLDWSASEPRGRASGLKRDIISDVILGADETTDLEFELFDPSVQTMLEPVLLAQERGTDAQLDYAFHQGVDDTNDVVIRSTITGKPGRFLLLDMIVAANDDSRVNSAIDGQVFVGSASPGAVPICCNLKPPGKNSPGSNPVLSNPPGGGGGAPDEPNPAPGPSTPDPSSSTSDGGNSCDANYSVVLPPTGSLTLESRVKPLPLEESEIALVGAFRSGHKIRNGETKLTLADGTTQVRRTSTVWFAARGVHTLSIELPRDRTLRETTEITLAVDTTKRQVLPIIVHQPDLRTARAGQPFVVADLGNGLTFAVQRSWVGPVRTRVELENASGGWVALPSSLVDDLDCLTTDGPTGTAAPLPIAHQTRSMIFNRSFVICYLPAGITAINSR